MSEQTTWNGFRAEEFTFEDKKAIVVFPDKANEKKSWTVKMEYWGAFPETEIELLKRGFHVTYIQNNNRWVTMEDCERKGRFVKFVIEKYGLAKKFIPVGMSLGGAFSINCASLYPELVQCMFIDAPVLNFVSVPGKRNAHNNACWDAEFVKAYPGITRAALYNFPNHPINRAPIVLEHKIPILMVYGTDDTVVEYEENGLMLEELYADHPELLTVMKRNMQGHHPHGFPTNPGVIADWIEAHA